MNDCDHCGTVERALTDYPKEVHDGCPCLCHAYRAGKLLSGDHKKSKKKVLPRPSNDGMMDIDDE